MDAAVFHEPRRRTIRLTDGDLSALDFGDADRPVDIIFSHANGFNAMTYRSILAPLAASLRILAIDQRGHGDSKLPADAEGRHDWKDLQRDLAGVLDAIGGPPVVLAGHSMGGCASVLAAAIRPARVKALVLFDPVIMPLSVDLMAQLPWANTKKYREAPIATRAAARRSVFPSAAEALAAYRGRGAFKTWPDTVLADYVAGGFHERSDGQVELACTPAWESSNFTCAAGNNTWGMASRIKAPITIYRAEHGSTCRIGSGRLFLRAHPQSRLIEVSGASHFLPMERPDIVRDALLDAAAPPGA